MDRNLAMEIISEWHEQELPDLVQRDISFEVPTIKKTIAIIGPRRAGKSFFLYEVISRILDVSREGTLFVNLEDHRLMEPKVEDLDILLKTYYEMFPDQLNSKMYLVLDEVQNVPGWERFVRSVMERFDITVLISGSSSKMLSREIATSMRGRSISFLVLPFSFKEFLKARNLKPSNSSAGKARMLHALKEYLNFGGFPEVVFEDKEMVKRKILRQYVDVMLFRDIVERHGITNIKVLKLLMGQMMVSSANQLSLNKFYGFLKSQGIKVDKNNIYEMKEHLLDAYGFIELKRINGSFREIEQGLPKIYPIDTGYMTDFGMHLDERTGKFMETCVALEMFRRMELDPGSRLNYWREDLEVDFVLSKGGKVVQLIQVCSDIGNEETRTRETKGLLKASNVLHCDDLILINWDISEHEVLDGKTIKIVPLWMWLVEP